MTDTDMILNTEMLAFSVYIADKTSNTKKQYLSKLHEIHKQFNKPARDITIAELRDFAQKPYKNTKGDKININTLATFVNVVIMIRNLAELDAIDYAKYYEEIKQESKQHLIQKNKDMDISALPTIADIHAQEQLYLDTKAYDKFIAHYLLTHYFTRNEDVNVKLITSKTELDGSGNFLLLTKKPVAVEYIRNDYKTMAKYGTKRYTITDKTFIKAFRELYKLRPQLLDTVADMTIDGKIGKFVRALTVKNVGEAVYLKIKLLALTDKTELLEIGERRGTDASTLLTSYNYDFNIEKIVII